jgi:hypothetical protein
MESGKALSIDQYRSKKDCRALYQFRQTPASLNRTQASFQLLIISHHGQILNNDLSTYQLKQASRSLVHVEEHKLRLARLRYTLARIYNIYA